MILVYHGVSRAAHGGIENCSRKHVPAAEFEAHMERLAREFTVLRLGELLEWRGSGTTPRRAVVVTFDDGFENNCSVALPILERYCVPATFFLATGFIGTGRTFWVDKIEYLLNESPLERLELETLGKRYALGSLAEKWQALQDIKRNLKTMPGLVDVTLSELERVSGTGAEYEYEDYRTLTWEQVREMRKSGLCEFGAHTVDHAILSHLSRSEKEYQIGMSKSAVERELGGAIRLFSYPEGQANHYDEETVEIVRSTGFSLACTAIFGTNTAATSEYHLHRNMVGFSAPFEECLEGLC